MSTPDTDPSLGDDLPHGRLLWWMRALAGALALVSLLSLWFSERARVRDDFQLSAESAARPGEVLALRAFYLQDVEAPSGPSLVTSRRTRVRLLDAHDRELARTELLPAHDDPSMEGSLELPETRVGGLWLEARTEVHGRSPLTCRRAVTVSTSAPNLVPRLREAGPLQQQALGALRPGRASAGSLAEPRASTRLELLPRVVGGVCAPEHRCTLLVWVGGEGASVTVRHDAAVELEQVTPALATAGFVEIVLRVHGPEASVVLEARQADELVAERTLRLPIGLGEAQLGLPRSLYVRGEPVPVVLQLPPGRSAAILDVFTQGRWRATRSVSARASTSGAGGEASTRLSPEQLGAGLVRLQAHTDRFSGEGAGTRLLFVREPGAAPSASLLPLSRALRAAGFEPVPWDEASGTLPAAADVEHAATFMLAALEGLRLPLPRAVSARPLELRRLSRVQTFLRYGISLLLLVCSVVVGWTLMRSGLHAQDEADALLVEAREAAREHDQEAGEPNEQASWASDEPDLEQSHEVRNKAHRSGVYLVVCLVLAVSLAFVLAALLIVAKPLWF